MHCYTTTFCSVPPKISSSFNGWVLWWLGTLGWGICAVGWLGWWWWWCGPCALRVCLSIRASSMQLIKMDWRQCTSPFGWTDQPEPPPLSPLPMPVASESRFQASPDQTSPNPQGEETDCEARPPHPPLVRKKGERNLFHLLGVGCPGSGLL